MPHCKFRKSDGVYLGGARWSIPVHDAATEIVIKLPEFPDAVTQRWDGATGLRPATAQELADVVAAESDAIATASLNTPINKLFQDLLFDLEQRVRTAGGGDSNLTDIAAVLTIAKYTAALNPLLKARS